MEQTCNRLLLPSIIGAVDMIRIVLHGALFCQTYGSFLAWFSYLFCYSMDMVADMYIHTEIGQTIWFYVWSFPSHVVLIGLTEWFISTIGTDVHSGEIMTREQPTWSLRLARSIVHQASLPLMAGLIQLVQFIPMIGYGVHLTLTGMLYAVYCFDAAWQQLGWSLPKRMRCINKNVCYLLSFGTVFVIIACILPWYRSATISLALYCFATIGIIRLNACPQSWLEGPEIPIFWLCRRLVISIAEALYRYCRKTNT